MERQRENLSLNGFSNFTGESASSSGVLSSWELSQMGKLPKEFEQKFLDYIDKRFILILLCTFIVHVSFIFYYSTLLPTEEFSKKNIARIQQQFVSLVLDKEYVNFEETQATQNLDHVNGISEEKSEGNARTARKGEAARTKVGSKMGRAATTENRTVPLDARREAHLRGSSIRGGAHDAISREVRSEGLLGLLIDSGSVGSKDGSAGILDELDASANDFNDALNNLGGIKTGGSYTKGSSSENGDSSRNAKARGGRATSSGNINDVIGDLSAVSSKKMGRKGKLMAIEAPAPVKDADGERAGSRDPDAVAEVVNRYNSAIQACYQRELRHNPSLRGKIAIRFTIAPSGKVKDAKIVSSTIHNKRVEQCIVNRIRRWDDFGAIDPSKGDSTFRQVYTFGY